jgi:hypothetical protein
MRKIPKKKPKKGMPLTKQDQAIQIDDGVKKALARKRITQWYIDVSKRGVKCVLMLDWMPFWARPKSTIFNNPWILGFRKASISEKQMNEISPILLDCKVCYLNENPESGFFWKSSPYPRILKIQIF